ncbi:APC family permease [Mycolicibacterium litorale]|uniref:Amino acid transporter n=1 Tax=Mycolicibacterium litorale TaxID=758802 RepID=A0AAD1MWU1_9MYCO|nr:APC family permease [Mycolicibacterium litorale]MCV7417555.1 APC family permease [Mycolicibacterium litorale]TDX99926.1 amino acid/polyamine/organocation transporter (APC superfamily) [Mycolicibacterium litorale]BBY18781.1 amino acid transporter [Mycolicibacterium litorale]
MSTDTTPSTGAERLQGRLGPVAVVFMVVAAAAPLTVIGGNLPLAFGMGNGAGAPIGFVIASLVLLLFSIGFVAMTPYVPEAGAFFSYVTLGLGRRLGTGVAAVALIAYTAIQVGIYGYIGWAIGDTVAFYGGPDLPWPLYAFATLAIVAVLGYRHIELSAKVLGVALALEIGIVALLDLVIVADPGPAGLTLTSFDPATFTQGAVGISVLFALTGFIGFEATAVFRDEARDPERTIPRATYAAVLIIGGFYALTCWAFVVAIGPDQVVEVAQRTLDGEGNMLLDTTDDNLGRLGRDIVNVLLLTSLFACVLSFHNVIARYQFALAGKGLLPQRLAEVHATHRSPAFSSIVQTVTAAVIVGVLAVLGVDPLVGVFGSMAGVATVGMVLLMLTTSVAVLVFFARNREHSGGRLWQTRIAPAVACVGLLGSLWLVLSNFTLVTGGSATVSTVLAAIPFAGLLAGTAVGGRLR